MMSQSHNIHGIQNVVFSIFLADPIKPSKKLLEKYFFKKVGFSFNSKE